MGKVLLATVGTGSGVEEAIAFSIHEANPELVVFLTTPQSSTTVEKAVHILGESPPPQQMVLVGDAENVEICYQAAVGVMRTLRGQGYSPTTITCDFTSGTKAMTAGLVLASLAEGCSVLSYVGGGRGADGRVIKGCEMLLRLRPVQIWLDRHRQQVVAFFNRHQFGAALGILEEMQALTGDSEVLDEIEQLRLLTLGYDAWDTFDHRRAQEQFESVHVRLLTRWRFAWEGDRRFLAGLLFAKNRYSDGMLCDLFLNATRRIEEGKLDDAVARLYRLCEMIAQAALARHGIDTADVDLSRVPDGVRPHYEERRNPKSKRIEIGLQEDYCLLEALGDPLGRGFLGNNAVRDALFARNDSILAHGTTPIGKEVCERLAAEAKRLLLIHASGAKRLLEDGAFAKLSFA